MLFAINVNAQGPSWFYTTTSIQHVFNFPEDVIVCSDDTLEIGDYIGLFYDSTGTLACAGYFVWNGGGQTVMAYGDDTLTTVKEGFNPDEEVTWKSYQFNAGLEYIHDAFYAHTPFYPDSGYFESNGASELVYLGNCVNPIISVITQDVSCVGLSDGSAWVDIFELYPPYTTTWAGGITADTIYGLSPGIHFVNVTNSLGYVTSNSLVINEPDSIELTFSNINVTEPGMPNGQINLTTSGGTPPYFYEWNNGATTQNLDNIFAGSYHVSVYDYYTCSNNDSTDLITVAPAPWEPIITSESHQVNIFPGTELFFTENGIEYGDVIGIFYDSTGVEKCAGLVIFTGAFDAMGEIIICYGDISTTTEIEGFLPGEELKWKIWDASAATEIEVFPDYLINQEFPDDGYFVNGGSSALLILSNIEHDMGISTFISPNTYCNLTSNEDITLEIYSAGMIEETIFDVKYNINGGPWLYETILQTLSYQDTIQITLATPANLISPINYQLVAIIEASNDLFADNDTAIIDIFPIITSAQTIQDTMSNCVGEATVNVTGGTPPYDYLWNDAGAQQTTTAVELCAGIFEASITDSLGCVVTQIANITNISPPSFTFDVSNVSCYGFNNGFINITMTNFQFPLNYMWSNGNFSEDLYNIGPGTYIITITDGTELSTVDTFIITQPDTMLLNVLVEDILCYGDMTGEIDLDVIGGVTPYLYFWSNGETTQDLSLLFAGTYNLTLKDDHNCQIIESIVVSQPDDLFIGYNIIESTQAGACDGAIYLSISGGNPPYTFSWNNGSTIEDLEQLCGGYYSLTITDQSNCEYFSSSINIYEPFPVISGEIFLGPNLMTDGIVILYNENSHDEYSAIEYSIVDSGIYSFTINPFNKFVIYAIPNPFYDFNYYPIYFPTYYGNNINWRFSEKIHTNYDILNADIFLESYDSLFFGYGSVNGTVNFAYNYDYESHIYYNNWFDTISFKYEESNPAWNIPLLLLKPDGSPVSFTLSGSDGKFSFNNIKYGDYIIYAEKAGFRTHEKHVKLTSEAPVLEDIQVLILNNNIYLSISSESINERIISLFPNPANDILQIDIPDSYLFNGEIHLYNSTGIYLGKLEILDNKVNISHLVSGVYFLTIRINSEVYSTKFIKVR